MNLTTMAFTSAVRLVLAALLGWATSRGWIPLGPTGNTVVLDVGSVAILGWSVYEGVNQARDVWSNVVSFARDAVAVILNWMAGMGYIGKGDIVPLEAALGTIVLYVWSVESKHLNLKVLKVIPIFLVGMLALGSMYGCQSGLFGGGAGKDIGDGLAVGSGIQGVYISNCVTIVNPYCSGISDNAKKASHAFTLTSVDIVKTYEAGGDTAALLAQLVVDAADLQSLIDDFKAKSHLKGIDPLTIITILNTGFQVYAQVLPLIQDMANGVSNDKLDALVKTIQDQDSQIQAS